MSRRITIGVLVPTHGEVPTDPPESRPIGRAAISLGSSGIDVIFGDEVKGGRISGYRAVVGGWEAAESVPLDAAHDRFPSQIRAQRYAEIMSGLGTLPLGNPRAFTMLCRDKLETQRVLCAQGVKMPPVSADPSAFPEQLEQWGSAFLKPRYGALGIGVTRVVPGDATPRTLPGVVPDRPDPSILQAAVLPPEGWCSRTVRVLIQREPEGGWWMGTPVVRQSRSDHVANAARGAQVAPGDQVLSARTLGRLADATRGLTVALDATDPEGLALEAGADFVLDADHEPWLIELNSRPRGRMEVLSSRDPKRYQAAHVMACARPILRLANALELTH